MTIRKDYVGGRWGQLHYRETGDGPAPPLVCLHATAYSSRTFVPLMPHVARGRRVIAIDTPGYGQSDGPPRRVPFAEYSEAIGESLRKRFGAMPVDLLGYHTGALLATELAAATPTAVGRLVLIGIPFFEGAERDAWRERLVHRHALGSTLDQFAARWDYFVPGRTPGLSLERAYACFVDELQAWPHDWWAHASLFDYDAGPRLNAVAQPTLVLNPTSALADASRRAARRMRDARVVELPSLTGAIFDLGTTLLAEHIDAFLARQ